MVKPLIPLKGGEKRYGKNHFMRDGYSLRSYGLPNILWLRRHKDIDMLCN